MRDRRQSKRFEVSIACNVERGSRIIRGHITNLSSSGALITQVIDVPPKDALVRVLFEFDKEKLQLEGVTSRVIHLKWEEIGGRKLGSFGVKFEEMPPEIQSRLNSIFHPVSENV